MTKPIFPHEMRSFAGMDELVELALDLRWSWNHSADDLWRPLAPELWDLTRNPWVILQTVAPWSHDHRRSRASSRSSSMPASLSSSSALRSS